jgi:AcrR family transcriptional regulator
MASADSGQPSHRGRNSAHHAAHAAASQKAARKVEQVAERLGAHVDKASAELARKAALLDDLTARIATHDVWTRPEPGARRTKFSRDEIAAAALRIADEEGFDALSMRRLASELDAGTMTLYHYVRTKDELLAIVNDSVMGELVIPDGELPSEWRDAISMIAHRSRDVLRRHPWTLDIRHDPAPGPNGFRHFDQSMQAVRPLEVSLAERFDLISAVDEYVFGFCMAERNNFVNDDPWTDGDVRDYMAGLVESGDYPALAAITAEYGIDGAFAEIARQASDPDRFTRNLNRLLDGFAHDVAGD